MTDPAEVVAFGEANGWPVAVKAAAGGGGRGIRVVAGPGDAAEALVAATREGAAFGDGACYLERFPRPRHVEVQVLADSHGAIVQPGSGTARCSAATRSWSRRRPRPGCRPRSASGCAPGRWRWPRRAAMSAPGRSSSSGPGLGRRLVPGDEHPHPGRAPDHRAGHRRRHRRRPAAGGGRRAARLAQDDVAVRGHAVECRVNAEDPARGFLPTPGTITALRWPGGPGVRVDAGYRPWTPRPRTTTTCSAR